MRVCCHSIQAVWMFPVTYRISPFIAAAVSNALCTATCNVTASARVLWLVHMGYMTVIAQKVAAFAFYSVAPVEPLIA